MKTKLKKTILLSVFAAFIFSGVLYLHFSINVKTAETKSSSIKINCLTADDNTERTFTEDTNTSFEDKARSVFKKGELSEIISNDGTYEEDTKISSVPRYASGF